MLVFSVNFNSYYLILRGKLKDSLNAEVRCFLVIVAIAITAVTLNIRSMFSTLGEALRHAAFTVASIISTTGFATVDFNIWPELSRTVIVLIMFVGACAGSTGGGLKVSRLMIFFKGIGREIKRLAHPKKVEQITMDGRPAESLTVVSVGAYIACYAMLFIVSSPPLLPFSEKEASAWRAPPRPRCRFPRGHPHRSHEAFASSA